MLEQNVTFEVIDRKEFRLDILQIDNIIPMVLIGNKRRVCNFIDRLNRSSAEFRSSLCLDPGKLIPFKMIDTDSTDSQSSINTIKDLVQNKSINLLCMYSETFNDAVKQRVRTCLNTALYTNDQSQYIKSISTIYLANADMRITRVEHRQSDIEIMFNSFHRKYPSYSMYPVIEWADIMRMRTDSVQVDDHVICTICKSEVSRSMMVTYDCNHASCMECAGTIVSISKICPFCMVRVCIDNLTLMTTYVPSVFMCIEEIIVRLENSKSDCLVGSELNYQALIYLDTFAAVQHLYNFLTSALQYIRNRLVILDDPTHGASDVNSVCKDLGSGITYHLACTNENIRELNRLQKIIVSPDTRISKELMLDYRSYGSGYGVSDQELIMIRHIES